MVMELWDGGRKRVSSKIDVCTGWRKTGWSLQQMWAKGGKKLFRTNDKCAGARVRAFPRKDGRYMAGQTCCKEPRSNAGGCL